MRLIKKEDVYKQSKHGINLSVYDTSIDEAGFVSIEVEEGHFEEFFHKVSTFIYYIVAGEGVFYIDEKPTSVKVGDLIVIPPNTKIYYVGKMKLNLVTTPAWRAEDEVHVRDIKLN